VVDLLGTCASRATDPNRPDVRLGQKQTFAVQNGMSAYPRKRTSLMWTASARRQKRMSIAGERDVSLSL
jgi:hypothetical protein